MTSGGRARGVRLLWPLAVLLGLTGLVLLGLGVAGSTDRSTTDLAGVVPGQEVVVPQEGMSVWSRSPQTRAATACTLDDTLMLRPDEDFTTRVEGQDFHEVARTGPGQGAGPATLVCDTDDAVYAGPYGPATAPTGLRGGAGLTLGLLLLPLGLACAALAVLARRRGEVTETGPDPAAYTLAQRPAGPEADRGSRRTSPTDAPTGPRYDLPPPPS
ncbi:hypothetical protein AVL62_02000 [Serinicoccus chungangensis]|uniref:Uncharacterized protein n=1 Tax=Serinicoccus chungangensis TaxID=767452 RepID=A0A0W8I5V6_9MICO|nr:hypothetical protein [Serinicoccus chungangensis]KUG53580.1 hypothetical protein AVL62_02000 [Serinicoccus chungangensis]